MIISRITGIHSGTACAKARVYKARTCTGTKRWQVHAMGRTLLTEISSLVWWRRPRRIFALAMLTLFLLSSVAVAGGASWRVGRGVIYGPGAEGGPSLKISLRNAGSPSTGAVRVFARWTAEAPGKRTISRGELSGFKELGFFSREVEMRKTVILEMTLAPLGSRPAEKRAVEVAVITGTGITDGVVIPMDF